MADRLNLTVCGVSRPEWLLGYQLVCGRAPGHDGDHEWRGPQDVRAVWQEPPAGIRVYQRKNATGEQGSSG